MTLLAAAALACDGQPRSILGDRDPNSVGGSAPAPLLGSWRAILLIDGGGDIQEWTTVWRFTSTGQCRLTKTVRSYLEGVSRTTTRECTYVDHASSVAVTYLDTKATVSMPYTVPLNSTTHLVIEGVDYERVS